MNRSVSVLRSTSALVVRRGLWSAPPVQGGDKYAAAAGSSSSNSNLNSTNNNNNRNPQDESLWETMKDKAAGAFETLKDGVNNISEQVMGSNTESGMKADSNWKSGDSTSTSGYKADSQNSNWKSGDSTGLKTDSNWKSGDSTTSGYKADSNWKSGDSTTSGYKADSNWKSGDNLEKAQLQKDKFDERAKYRVDSSSNNADITSSRAERLYSGDKTTGNAGIWAADKNASSASAGINAASNFDDTTTSSTQRFGDRTGLGGSDMSSKGVGASFDGAGDTTARGATSTFGIGGNSKAALKDNLSASSSNSKGSAGVTGMGTIDSEVASTTSSWTKNSSKNNNNSSNVDGGLSSNSSAWSAGKNDRGLNNDLKPKTENTSDNLNWNSSKGTYSS